MIAGCVYEFLSVKDIFTKGYAKSRVLDLI